MPESAPRPSLLPSQVIPTIDAIGANFEVLGNIISASIVSLALALLRPKSSAPGFCTYRVLLAFADKCSHRLRQLCTGHQTTPVAFISLHSGRKTNDIPVARVFYHTSVLDVEVNPEIPQNRSKAVPEAKDPFFSSW